MEKMIEMLKSIGIPAEICESIQEHYEGDETGLKDYVLIARALFDDRSEYVE